MAAISGKYSKVLLGSCNMLEFGAWSANIGSTPQPYASRSGGGWMRTVDGVSNAEGSIEGFLDPDDPLTAQITSGSLVTLSLYHRVTSAVLWTGQARLGQFSVSANRDGTPQPVSIPFSGEGEWTPPS